MCKTKLLEILTFSFLSEHTEHVKNFCDSLVLLSKYCEYVIVEFSIAVMLNLRHAVHPERCIARDLGIGSGIGM